MTQTLHHKHHHSDILIKPRKEFVPAELTTEDYTSYLKDLRDYRVAEVGTCTSGKDPMHKVRRRKWNSTANYYTRRDSLKGSSEDDDTLEAEKVTKGVAREKVNVGVEKLGKKNANNWQKYAAPGWQSQVMRDRAAAAFAGKVIKPQLLHTPGLSNVETNSVELTLPVSAMSTKITSLSGKNADQPNTDEDLSHQTNDQPDNPPNLDKSVTWDSQTELTETKTNTEITEL